MNKLRCRIPFEYWRKPLSHNITEPPEDGFLCIRPQRLTNVTENNSGVTCRTCLRTESGRPAPNQITVQVMSAFDSSLDSVFALIVKPTHNVRIPPC